MANLQVIEYQAKRVLTTQQLAVAYGTKDTNIQTNFNSNKDRFVVNRDYYLLEGAELKAFKDYISDTDVVAARSPSLYLWTERGANRHCKILDTSQAWEQFDVLEETYFNVKTMCMEDVMIAQLQGMKDVRLQLEQNSAGLVDANNNIKRLEAKITNIPVEYFTIAGYASLRGIKVDTSRANLLGRQGVKLSRQYAVHIGKVSDAKYGQVNTYHLDILKQIFN